MPTAGNILIGPATVSLAPYPGAGNPPGQTLSYVEMGHTNGPVSWSPNFTDVEIKSDQVFGVIKKVPIDLTITVKIPALEATIDPITLAVLRQPASRKFTVTTAGNDGIYIGAPVEQYHCIKFEGGAGTGLPASSNDSRRIQFWKCIVTTVGEIKFAKAEPVMYDITFTALYDDSISSADKFARLQDF